MSSWHVRVTVSRPSHTPCQAPCDHEPRCLTDSTSFESGEYARTPRELALRSASPEIVVSRPGQVTAEEEEFNEPRLRCRVAAHRERFGEGQNGRRGPRAAREPFPT